MTTYRRSRRRCAGIINLPLRALKNTRLPNIRTLAGGVVVEWPELAANLPEQSTQVTAYQPIEADTVALREAHQVVVFESSGPCGLLLWNLPFRGEDGHTRPDRGVRDMTLIEIFPVHAASPLSVARRQCVTIAAGALG